MNPKLLRNRLSLHENGSSGFSIGTTDTNNLKSSLRDQAELLLSIADIAESEIATCPSALDYDQQRSSPLPQFPSLDSSCSKSKVESKLYTSCADSLQGLLNTANNYHVGKPTSHRVRTVSIDNPSNIHRRTPSPLSSPPLLATYGPVPVTPVNGTGRLIAQQHHHRSARLSHKARHEHQQKEQQQKEELIQLEIPTSPRADKDLQDKPPKNVNITKIYRRKFSWKNYPELEQFLVANREEYLRHSALNYTLQQKQYNNKLTERLLELATSNGYVFDTIEFNFVTVRDRIRCYYKSYVQSAKKRGILMGYAARKAGLLTDEDLSAGQAGRIITP